jgi:hypothetical protein
LAGPVPGADRSEKTFHSPQKLRMLF